MAALISDAIQCVTELVLVSRCSRIVTTNVFAMLLMLASASFYPSASAAPPPKRSSREYVVDAARLSSQEQALVRRVRAEMNATVFPAVSFRSTPLQEAIDWITHHISSHSPSRMGMSMVLHFREEPAPSVTLSLREATLPQILDAICSQTGYVWGVESYALSIVPAESLRTPKPK